MGGRTPGAAAGDNGRVSARINIGESRRRAGVPAVVEVAGASMAPGLLRGYRLRVVPLSAPPVAGDVVVLRSPATLGLVVHRVVALAQLGGRAVVLHRGDAGGRVGMAHADAVVGRAAAVLDPPGESVPALGGLAAAQRRAFERAQARCRFYVKLSQRARDGRGARFLWRPLARLARRFWLR